MRTKINALSEPVKILRRLQAFGYKSAIIAGGAIRDDYTGKEINDYDIFLWDPRHSSEFTFLQNATHNGPRIDVASDNFEMERTTEFVELLQTFDVDQIFQAGAYGALLTGDGSPLDEPGIGARLTGIWEAEFDYNDYQLIYTQVNPVVHVEKYFDIGLCKAYCDGVKIRYTPDFMRDLKNKTFTIVAQDMTSDQFTYAVDHHAAKLEKKYPGFNVDVAPHNQNLFADYIARNS
jgi:hypothetical protein